jgi:hypothetical protein
MKSDIFLMLWKTCVDCFIGLLEKFGGHSWNFEIDILTENFLEEFLDTFLIQENPEFQNNHINATFIYPPKSSFHSIIFQ